MQGFYRGVAGEIAAVERQYPLHSVHVHGCHQTGIVNLYARHSVGDDQSSPLAMHRGTVVKNIQGILDDPGSQIRFVGAEPVTVAARRSGAGIPEFSKVL